jgi:hypothetical protein
MIVASVGPSWQRSIYPHHELTQAITDLEATPWGDIPEGTYMLIMRRKAAKGVITGAYFTRRGIDLWVSVENKEPAAKLGPADLLNLLARVKQFWPIIRRRLTKELKGK